MAEDNKMKRCPVTLQPDIEELLDWNHYSADDFDSASQTEKKDFIQERQSVSYWKDAWRRLKKNVVAMVALGVIIFLVLFAFVGPYLVPYGYDQFNKGAENLHLPLAADEGHGPVQRAGLHAGAVFVFHEHKVSSSLPGTEILRSCHSGP